MIPFRRRYVFAVAGLILMLLASFGIAYAVNIIVDGNPSDWNSIAPLFVDPEEATIPANVNFSQGFGATSFTSLFWRFDTYSNTRYTPVGVNTPFVYICMDIVGNPGPGILIPQCNAVGHFEYLLRIDGSPTGTPSASLFNCTTGACVIEAGATLSVAHQFTVTEASVGLTNVGLLAGNSCTGPQLINVAYYFDNQDLPPDDTMPNAGTVQLTIPCPTVIQLSSVTAKSANGTPIMLIALAGIAGVGVASVLVLRRRRR